ncbi:MAG: hypothetical protein V4665_03365 [Patescibacteria group bacterium]
MNPEELLKTTDLQHIATEGAKIYEKIRGQYENETNKGKFLAIDIESEDIYLSPTSAEAVVLAKAEHPNKVFFVKKIGFDAAETMAHLMAVK